MNPEREVDDLEPEIPPAGGWTPTGISSSQAQVDPIRERDKVLAAARARLPEIQRFTAQASARLDEGSALWQSELAAPPRREKEQEAAPDHEPPSAIAARLQEADPLSAEESAAMASFVARVARLHEEDPAPARDVESADGQPEDAREPLNVREEMLRRARARRVASEG